jgi:hypothetical protein
MVKKPIIYLYPPNPTDVTLQVDFKGEFSFTYPEYKNGWHVNAQHNGKLIDKADGHEYNYLFWDGIMSFSKDDVAFKDGFVVHKDSVVSFLKRILPQLGLLPHEYNDFIVFWTPFLQKHTWNFIHFGVGKEYDKISINTVKPKIDNEIRVFMYFKSLHFPIDVVPQKFETPLRNGFTLVEWGGAELP